MIASKKRKLILCHRLFLQPLIFSCFILMSSQFTQAYSEEKDHVFKLAGPVFPPYYYYDDQKNLKGDLVDIYAKIIENAGYKWQGELLPARRLMSSLENGQFDSSLLVQNTVVQNPENFMCLPFPISQVYLNTYSKMDKMIIQKKEDLLHSKVIVMRGYGYGGIRAWLDDHKYEITLIETNSFDSALLMLENDRADYALLYEVNYETALETLGFRPDNIQETLLESVPIFLHLTKSQFKNPEAILKDLTDSYFDLIHRGKLAPSRYTPQIVAKGRQ